LIIGFAAWKQQEYRFALQPVRDIPKEDVEFFLPFGTLSFIQRNDRTAASPKGHLDKALKRRGGCPLSSCSERLCLGRYLYELHFGAPAARSPSG
jgi:hypothetical protein